MFTYSAMINYCPFRGLLCRGIKKSMLVRPVWVRCESVSHAPNGCFTPNIHTWDSHMPYGYFPEMFENFTKLSKLDSFLAQNALAELHTRSKMWSKWCRIEIVHNRYHITCPIWTGLLVSAWRHMTCPISTGLLVLTSPKGATPPLGVLSSLVLSLL